VAKSQGALILITLFIGALFFLSGLVFTLQGEGIVGPSNGFMFDSKTWIYNGLVILAMGIVLLGIGVFFRAHSKAKISPAQQNASEDQKTPPGPNS
jgi:hypothetical protein